MKKINKSLYEGMRFVDTILGEAHSDQVESLKRVIRENRDGGRACYDQMWEIGCGTRYDLIREYMGYSTEDELLGDELIPDDHQMGTSDMPDMSHQGDFKDHKIVLMKKDATGSWVPVDEFHMSDNPKNVQSFASQYAKDNRVGVKVEPQGQAEYSTLDETMDETIEFGLDDMEKIATKGSWEAKADGVKLAAADGISLREFLEKYDTTIRSEFASLREFRNEVSPLVTVTQKGNLTPILIYTIQKYPSRIITKNWAAIKSLEEAKAPRHWAYKDGEQIYTAEFPDTHDEAQIRETIESLRQFSPKAYASKEQMHEDLKSW